MIEFTTVCGVDRKHLKQLAWTWPTWKRHKPMLLERPMLIFFDRVQLTEQDVRGVCDHPDLMCAEWPLPGTDYGEDMPAEITKWERVQRYKMLAGFVHIPALLVGTEYWLKIDTDSIATGCPDWIDPKWFDGRPAIVAQKWGFTKPANQMTVLDDWADRIGPVVFGRPRLDLPFDPTAGRMSHKRIISWCGFFRTEFTRVCSGLANRSVPTPGGLPVKSQDGFMFYCAKRMGVGVVRINVKSRGWLHRSTMKNVEQESIKAMLT